MTANNDPLGVEFCLSVSRGRIRRKALLVSASTPNWLSPKSRYLKSRPYSSGLSTRDSGAVQRHPHKVIWRGKRATEAQPEKLKNVMAITEFLASYGDPIATY
jgi:hypothetical protein